MVTNTHFKKMHYDTLRLTARQRSSVRVEVVCLKLPGVFTFSADKAG